MNVFSVIIVLVETFFPVINRLIKIFVQKNLPRMYLKSKKPVQII